MFSIRIRREAVFGVWCFLALAAALFAPNLLNGSFPILTVVWILVPLLVVCRTKDAGRVGFRTVRWRELLLVTAINLAGLLGVIAILEPGSHTYRMLVETALSQPAPDTTFAWLVRLPRLPALGGMLLYSGLVTMFGEELFFRGWLLQSFTKRWGPFRAVFVQALLFTLPNLLAAFVLPPLQGFLYVLGYTFVGVGMVGGWAASRTGSIWPSLISAAIGNLILVALMG